MSKGKSYDETLKKNNSWIIRKMKKCLWTCTWIWPKRKNIYNWTKLYGTIKSEDSTLTNNKDIIELNKENARL